MNEGMVPNRRKRINGKWVDPNTDNINDHPWWTIKERASSTVKLKILFLAGLLDIAHDI